MALEDTIRFLDQLGVWDVLIPFMLVFTLVYAVLEKTRVLGEENGSPKSRINAAVAAMVGFISLVFVELLNVINTFISYITVAIIGVLILAIFAGFLGFTDDISKNLLFASALVIVAGVGLYAAGLLGALDLSALRRFLEGPLIALAVMFLLIWFIVRPSKEEKSKKGGKNDKDKDRRKQGEENKEKDGKKGNKNGKGKRSDEYSPYKKFRKPKGRLDF